MQNDLLLTVPEVTLNQEQIQKLIPHRPPFLFVEQVTIKQNRTAQSISRWRADEEFFKGHFPQLAIVPGVYLIEAAAQTAAVMAMHYSKYLPSKEDNGIGVLAGVRRFVVRQAVYPDDVVDIKIKFSGSVGRGALIDSKAFKGDVPIFEGQLMVARM